MDKWSEKGRTLIETVKDWWFMNFKRITPYGKIK